MFKSLKSDIPASIVVFFVALPLCLGIALASGAPLFSGLIAGFEFSQGPNLIIGAYFWTFTGLISIIQSSQINKQT